MCVYAAQYEVFGTPGRPRGRERSASSRVPTTRRGLRVVQTTGSGRECRRHVTRHLPTTLPRDEDQAADQPLGRRCGSSRSSATRFEGAGQVNRGLQTARVSIPGSRNRRFCSTRFGAPPNALVGPRGYSVCGSPESLGSDCD